MLSLALALSAKMLAKLPPLEVNKIVLVTHMGYNNDLSLMASLRGVDVVIGGDSHSLLGNNVTRDVVGFSTVQGEYATASR